MPKMLLLLMRVFLCTGIAWCLLMLAVALVVSATLPLSKLSCNARINWSEFDPLAYPVGCGSKLQYLLTAFANALNPASLATWIHVSVAVFVFMVIFLSLTYKPE